MTLYKLNRLIEDYPIIGYMIDHVDFVQQGRDEHTIIVKVFYKQFCNETRKILDK